MIRKGTKDDIKAVAEIYSRIHDMEEAGKVTIGWVRAIYPTQKTAEDALAKDELFVLEDCGEVVAAAKINREQVPEYADCKWENDAPDDEVMVLHTLVVDPLKGGKGYGTQFVDFYEKYALENGCKYLRMDTNEKNANARKLYKKLGYKEPGIVPCVFNGIDGVQLVCLEKTLK
ncbi:GNAT family N-acetyltransferase [Anaerotignum sp. MSJ-24]|uniref:GNAT family N-acetyltransferase n=1 Tax=Anaerotignum sp. MSJ-24 TaxID=2841521 RepID=UPI001C121E5B|nr:GNAT family N-acetyltransferase [Anaerotignum sp. MSJ-24]MBU5464998.1 GNAT family N-acetyltransferase [Anaerotignum sp. MSJ-24]